MLLRAANTYTLHGITYPPTPYPLGYSVEGKKIYTEQLKAIQELSSQIERAESTKIPIIMMGDMNMCSYNFLHYLYHSFKKASA